MLYPTLNQPFIMIAIFLVGLACGIIFDIARLLSLLSGEDKVARHIFDFLATVISFLVLFFVNLKINYGQFRFYIIMIFLLSFALERFLSQKLWTKLVAKWYSSIAGRKNRDRKDKTK